MARAARKDPQHSRTRDPWAPDGCIIPCGLPLRRMRFTVARKPKAGRPPHTHPSPHTCPPHRGSMHLPMSVTDGQHSIGRTERVDGILKLRVVMGVRQRQTGGQIMPTAEGRRAQRSEHGGLRLVSHKRPSPVRGFTCSVWWGWTRKRL